MGVIINIDEALKLRSDYNVLREPLNEMIKSKQETWEKENPIDMLFARGTINGFQETFTSSIGFDHAFSETGDYAVGPIFNTAEGFAATYRTRTFQGSFIITKQVLEDGKMGQVRDDASQFVKRWHGDIVEYAMKSIEGGFADATWVGGDGKETVLKLYSADTQTGEIDGQKNRLFTTAHKTVKRGNATPYTQSNIYGSAITLTDPDAVAKVADLINQVITEMENYRDDNGKYAGVTGAKSIVCANDPQLKAVINSALSLDMFKAGAASILNPAYKRATMDSTPYLRDVASHFVTSDGSTKVPMFFIVDKAYNSENHGLEFTERIPFTLDVIEEKRPAGIIYDGRQRFDINVATWRGIAAVFLGTSVYHDTTQLTVTSLTTNAIATPVSIVGQVDTN